MTDVARGIVLLAIIGGFFLFWFLLLVAGVVLAVLLVRVAAKPVGNYMLWTMSSSYGWIERERQLGRYPPRR